MDKNEIQKTLYDPVSLREKKKKKNLPQRKYRYNPKGTACFLLFNGKMPSVMSLAYVFSIN